MNGSFLAGRSRKYRRRIWRSSDETRKMTVRCDLVFVSEWLEDLDTIRLTTMNGKERKERVHDRREWTMIVKAGIFSDRALPPTFVLHSWIHPLILCCRFLSSMKGLEWSYIRTESSQPVHVFLLRVSNIGIRSQMSAIDDRMFYGW